MNSAPVQQRFNRSSLPTWVKVITRSFHGGVHPEEFKTISNQLPIDRLAQPEKIIVPLSQHLGNPATPIVSVGAEVIAGQLIAEAAGHLSVNIHAPYCGTIEKIETSFVAHPSGMDDLCIHIKTNDKEAVFRYPKISDYKNTEIDELVKRINEAGIAGLGGAGFPTHIKLGTQINTLIINAAECEPYISCDDKLLQEEPNEFVEAAICVAHIVNAEKIIIGIEDNKPEAIEKLIAAIESAHKKNQSDLIELHIVPTKYPSGGEKQLFELLTQKQLPPSIRPAQLGYLIHNVATIRAAYRAIVFGEPLTERVVTVTGDACPSPKNYWIKIGTRFADVLAQTESQHAQQMIMGGPMMGFEVKNSNAPVVKTTNCILLQKKAHQVQEQPCIRCGECATACPASLLPQQLYWFARSDNFEKAQEYHLSDCIECGACAYVCPSEIPLVQYYRYAKSKMKEQAIAKAKSEHAKERHEFREMRLAREKQERAEKHKQAALARKQAAEKKGIEDEKKATVADAVARAKARKQALTNKNNEND